MEGSFRIKDPEAMTLITVIIINREPSPMTNVTSQLEEDVNPKHYKGCSIIGSRILQGIDWIDFGSECIEVIETNPILRDSFILGNAFKYIWRAGRKGDAKTDLAKALWYLNRIKEDNALQMYLITHRTKEELDKLNQDPPCLP